MAKTRGVFKKISTNSDLINKFQNAQSFEEIYELCRKIEPNITEREVETGMLQLLMKPNQKEVQKVSDEELDMIAGGKMDFNTFKASAVTALLLLGGITATAAVDQVPVHASSVDSISVSASIDEKINVKKDQSTLDQELLKAAQKCDKTTIENLLKGGANINTEDALGKTPLIIIASGWGSVNIKERSELADFLIKNGAYANVRDNSYKSALDYVSDKSYEIKNPIEYASKNQGDIHITQAKTQEQKQKLLDRELRCERNNVDRFKRLLDYGANVNLKDKEGRTILFYSRGNPEIIKLLIEYGADINVKDKQGETPLMLAASQNNIETAQILLNNGADINAKNDDGVSALTRAMVEDDRELKRIIDTGKIHISMLDEENISMVSRTVAQEREEMAKFLLARGALKDSANQVLFVQAAKKGSLNLIKLFIKFDVDIETKDYEGKTALISAAEKGRTEIVKWLLSSGANINATDNQGKTVLMRAIEPDPKRDLTLYENFYKSKGDIAQILIDNGADLNIKDNDGQSALIYAIKNHSAKTTETLIKKGADVNAKDKNAITVLMYAVYHSSVDNIKMLLEKGSKTNEQSADGETALIYAAKRQSGSQQQNSEIIKLLVKNGADVSLTDKNNRNILFHALSNRLYDRRDGRYNVEKEILNTVIETGVDINAKDIFGNTALMSAASCGDINCIKILLEKGTDINAKNNDGYTALMFAKNKEVIELLLNKGADINAVNNEGQNAFMLGVYWEKPSTGSANDYFYTPNKNIDVLKFLIEKGVDISIKNNKGQDVYSIANEKNRTDVLSLLKENETISQQEKTMFDNSRKLLNAASENSYEKDRVGTIKNLLNEKNIDINAKNEKGMTALQIIVDKGYSTSTDMSTDAYKNDKNILKMLLKKGADVNIGTPLAIASWNNKELVELLIANGADVNGKNDVGKTALMCTKNPDIVSFLLEKGADINAKDNNGKTALMHLAEYENVMKILVKSGADVNAKDNDGQIPLMHALKNYYIKPETIKFLVENGADINAKDNNGISVLVYSFSNKGESIAFLIGNGADISAKDNNGKSVFAYATGEKSTHFSFQFPHTRGGEIKNILREVARKRNLPITELYQAPLWS